MVNHQDVAKSFQPIGKHHIAIGNGADRRTFTTTDQNAFPGDFTATMLTKTADLRTLQRPWQMTSFLAQPFMIPLGDDGGGLGFGGAIIGGLLTYYGYVANEAQTPTALEGIRLNATIWASVPFFLAALALLFYPITKKLNLEIQDELADRRKKFSEA